MKKIYFKKCRINLPHSFYKDCACSGIVIDRDLFIRFYDKWHYVIGTLLILIGWAIILWDSK